MLLDGLNYQGLFPDSARGGPCSCVVRYAVLAVNDLLICSYQGSLSDIVQPGTILQLASSIDTQRTALARAR